MTGESHKKKILLERENVGKIEFCSITLASHSITFGVGQGGLPILAYFTANNKDEMLCLKTGQVKGMSGSKGDCIYS
jgi:hypothetical protein